MAIEIKYYEDVYWDTLAAAYAETGNFIEAINSQEKAIDLLPDSEIVERDKYYKRLKSYVNSIPYRNDSVTLPFP